MTRRTAAAALLAGGAALAAAGGLLAGPRDASVPQLVIDTTRTFGAPDRAGGDLAATPPMGWNGWNAYGCRASADLVERTADAIVATGMREAGYRYVNLDDCWMATQRGSDGSLAADPAAFPAGMRPVADYVHSRGLRFGIYADAGTTTCTNQGYPGSYGHERQDAATFASWGVDYVKLDQCAIPFGDFPGLSHAQVDRLLYTRFAEAMRATGRPMVFAVCTAVDTDSDPATWAPSIGNLWRTTGDIEDSFAATTAIARAHAPLAAAAARPGRWADPDMLEVGNGGQSEGEYRAQFSLWAEFAAPLLAGTDLPKADPATLAILKNRAVIAVDQDPLGLPGRRVADAADGDLMTFAKPLANGDVAVLLLNAGEAAASIRTSSAAVGLGDSRSVRLVDLWSGAVTWTDGGIEADVAPHAVAMFRATAQPR